MPRSQYHWRARRSMIGEALCEPPRSGCRNAQPLRVTHVVVPAKAGTQRFGRKNRKAASTRSLPAAHRQHLAGDPAGIVGGEEEDGMGDIGGRAEAAERDTFDEALLPFGAVGLPLLLGRRVGAHEAGSDAVDGDAEGAELVRE